MDEITADALIGHRETVGAFPTVGDILEVERVSDDAFQEVAGYLTTRSSVWGAVAHGSSPEGVSYTIRCCWQVEEDGEENQLRVLHWSE